MVADDVVTCSVTGAVLSSGSALRLVQAPDGRWVPDLKWELPGKALDIAFSPEALQQAIVQHQLEGEDIAGLVAAQLRKRALGYLGLLRRSGGMVAGFEKVQETLKRAPSGAWECAVHAADAGADGVRKLRGAQGEMAEVTVFSRHELAQATGFANPVHLLLKADALTSKFVEAARRLQQWQQES